MTKNEAIFTKNIQSKTLTVVRPFSAPLETVWNAWTRSEILDQWWAPKPYIATTAEMDFREGGHWRYNMKGPDGDTHWCQFNYKTIEKLRGYTGTDMFCDEEGNRNEDLPSMAWSVQFGALEGQTIVTVVISFTEIEDMETIIKMGFQEGFTMGLGNLDEVLLTL